MLKVLLSLSLKYRFWIKELLNFLVMKKIQKSICLSFIILPITGLLPSMVHGAQPPIELEIVSPANVNGDDGDPKMWEYRSGWLLSLKLIAKDKDTPVFVRGSQFFPVATWPAYGELSFWIIQDLENCPF